MAIDAAPTTDAAIGSHAAGGRLEHDATRDGTSLLIRHRPVEAGEPWAAVLLVHGLAEHCGRYDRVGARFARAGIDAHGFDLRGFGGSGGRRAWVDRWSQLHDDLEERLVAIRSIAPSRPLVLSGHSLGGLIALGYVLDGRARPDLLILSAPAVGANIPLWQRLLVGSLRRMTPGLLLGNRIDPEGLSCDSGVGEAYVADPLNQHRTTIGFAHAAFGEQRRVAAELDRLSLPTLVLHGSDDPIVPPQASERLEGLPGVTRKVYPGLRHEVHNELAGHQVVADEIDWIRERVSRMHPASAST